MFESSLTSVRESLTNHLRTHGVLISLLILGRALDAGSTMVVLTASDSVYESRAFARGLIAQFGLVEAMLLSVPIAVISLVAIGLLIDAGYPRLADALDATALEPLFPWLVRGVYGFGAVWFAYLGVSNTLLLF